MDTRDTEHLIEALTNNWQVEMRGYHTYNALSKRATDPQQCRSLHSLALAEQHHADLWASRLTALGSPVPEYNGSEAGEADSLANRIGGLRPSAAPPGTGREPRHCALRPSDREPGR